MRRAGMKIAVAIPARNEERTIGSVVALSRRITPHIVVINDGSEDRTEEVAKAAGAFVINHEVNKGKGAAIQTAFSWAKAARVDILVLLDGDGQHDPREIPKLLEPILKGEAEITIGSRWVEEEGLKEMPSHRKLGNKILTLVTQMAGSAGVKDTQSGFRAFRGDVLDKLYIYSYGFEVESALLIQASQRGYRIVEVPVKCRYGDLEANTERSSSHGFRVLNFLLSILRKEQPLKYFVLLSLPFMLATAYFGYNLLLYFRAHGHFLVSYAFLTAAGMIITSFIIYAGLILQAINRRSKDILNRIEELYEIR
ncbi:MAG: glycosyltransferase family 2 protein [Thermoplasmata archaeon]|nr:glycosyltransferase family 2 protein [Thermoplasmata archaeon]